MVSSYGSERIAIDALKGKVDWSLGTRVSSGRERGVKLNERTHAKVSRSVGQ